MMRELKERELSMKIHEQFALDYFLTEYPSKTSFRVILEIVRGHRIGWVDVWEPFANFDSHVLVGMIITLKNSLDDKFLEKK